MGIPILTSQRLGQLAGSVLLSALALGSIAPASADTSLVIATASPTGVYHITGRILCRLVQVPCEARPSGGSIDNLRALRAGEVPIALAQSDLQYHAVSGPQDSPRQAPTRVCAPYFQYIASPSPWWPAETPA